MAREHAEETLLRIPHSQPNIAALVPADRPIDPAIGSAQKVPVHALDDLLEGRARNDFLKIDAEGAEEASIAGFDKTLTSQRPLMVLEFNPRCKSPADLLARLRRGYAELRCLSYYGEASAITDEALLDPTDGEDRLAVVG